VLLGVRADLAALPCAGVCVTAEVLLGTAATPRGFSVEPDEAPAPGEPVPSAFGVPRPVGLCNAPAGAVLDCSPVTEGVVPVPAAPAGITRLRSDVGVNAFGTAVGIGPAPDEVAGCVDSGWTRYGRAVDDTAPT
jgi:hypothetical protein